MMNSVWAQNGKVKIYDPFTGQTAEVDRVVHSKSEWKKILTPEAYRVTRLKGTETPFAGQCDLPTKMGNYQCVCCGTDLFNVEKKFVSGTGWPSFFDPVSSLNIQLEKDRSFGMKRTEVLCRRCGAHLGHVFNDGPPPTGKRYCINSIALKFHASEPKALEHAVFAAGCFWGVEDSFLSLKGVVATQVGYTGGTLKNPSYEDVCTGRTGHAEALEVSFDPAVISYDQLLEFFLEMHDPTTLDRQGPDVGNQYRSAIFYRTAEQREAALKAKERAESSGAFQDKIVTEIVPAEEFYPAEEYHQKYFQKRGTPGCHVPPKKKKIQD